MATIPLPAKFGFSRVSSFKLRRKTNKLRSRFTAQAQSVSYPYAIWMLEADLIEYDGIEAAEIRSFLVDLDGTKNNFRLPVPGITKPTTGYTANRAVSVAAAVRAMSLTVSGGANGVPYLNRGDYFTINDELKMVTAPVAFNAGGTATVQFKPFLRKALVVGNTVIVNNPTVLLEAADDDIAEWGILPPYRQGSSLVAVESISI